MYNPPGTHDYTTAGRSVAADSRFHGRSCIGPALSNDRELLERLVTAAQESRDCVRTRPYVEAMASLAESRERRRPLAVVHALGALRRLRFGGTRGRTSEDEQEFRDADSVARVRENIGCYSAGEGPRSPGSSS